MFRSYSEKICRTDLKPRSPRALESYSCDICDESNWLSETDVELHRKEKHFRHISLQMKHNLDRFCTICMKMQDSRGTLIAHLKTHHLFSSPNARRVEREIFICDHCNHIFFNKDMLITHMMYAHMWSAQERNTKTFTCPKCKKICKLKSIWFHFQLHEIPSISACDICLLNLPNTEELFKHLDTHMMYYKCEVCDHQTTKDVHFEKHLDQHQSQIVKQQVVNGKLVRGAFWSQSPLSVNPMLRYNIHHSLRGLELPRFMHICILCREICLEKNEMKNHIVRDHHILPEAKKQWTCLCGAEFFSQILLKHHIFKMKGRHRPLNENEAPEQLDPLEMSHAMQLGTEDIDEHAAERGVIMEVPIDGVCIVNDDDQLSYIYAEVDENRFVTIDDANEGEVIGF